MSKILVIRKETLLLFILFFLGLCAVGFMMVKSMTTSEAVFGSGSKSKEISIITTEFKTTTSDGREIEVYRWSPDTIVVHKGDDVTLRFYGVHGKSHSFLIEGLNVKGEVKKGEETAVRFNANEEGIFRIICTTHADYFHHGPMTGHLVVLDE